MKKRTKALDISPKVKQEVWERDEHMCILCGNPNAMPNAHYIARSQGGLGIAKNVVTLCFDCHNRYDNSADRKTIREQIKAYLMNKYPDWDEKELYYKKWS
jgi:5-methylcytosine-specific restriction endonuclease McrA